MSWYRVEGGMPQHAKYAPLSDAAFRLAITAGAWCADRFTDGFIPKKMVPNLTRAPVGKRLDAAVRELVNAGIWEEGESNSELFHLHDFLQWNMSKSQWEAKKAAGRAGGEAKAANYAPAKHKQSPQQKASTGLAPARELPRHQLEQVPQHLPSTCSSVPLADSDSDSDSEIEIDQRSQIPISPPGGKRSRTREAAGRSMCPSFAAFEVSEATLKTAQQLGVDWRQHFERMRDWSLSGGKQKADWNATLRNFMHGSPNMFRVQASAPTQGSLPLAPRPAPSIDVSNDSRFL